MTNKALLKVVCLTVIGAPPIFAATQGLEIPPVAAAVMAILALAAGYTLSELDPGFRGRGAPVTPDDLADEIMALPESDRAALRIEIERRRGIRMGPKPTPPPDPEP